MRPAVPPCPFPDGCCRAPAHGRDRGARRTAGTATLGSAEDFFIGVQRDPGANLSDFDVARFFNKARCDCDEIVYVYVALTNAGFAKRTPVDRTGTSSSGSGPIARTPSSATSAASAAPPGPDDGGVPQRQGARRCRRTRACSARIRRQAASSTAACTGGNFTPNPTCTLPLESYSTRRSGCSPTTTRSRRDRWPRAPSTSTSRRRPRRTRLLTAKGGQQAVDAHLAGRRLRRHHRRARLSGVVQPRRRPAGVLGRHVRTRLPDLLQEPHAHAPAFRGSTRASPVRPCCRRRRDRFASRSCRTTSPTAWRSSRSIAAATPAPRTSFTRPRPRPRASTTSTATTPTAIRPGAATGGLCTLARAATTSRGAAGRPGRGARARRDRDRAPPRGRR